MVRVRDIIGVFDIQVQDNPNTASFLDFAQRNQAIEVVEVGEVKSFIVTEQKLYFSPISSLTLKKRAHFADHPVKAEADQ